RQCARTRCVTFPYVNSYILPLRSCLRICHQLVTSRADQKAAISAGVLDRYTHDPFYELFEHYLAGECLRDLDHCSDVEPFDGYFDRARGTRRPLFMFQPGMELLKLPHLAVGPPSQVAGSRLPHISVRDHLEAARGVEAGGQLVGESLVMHKFA